MTLIVGLACTNGIVMGAYSASIDPLSRTKLTVNKIQRMGKYPILFGASGAGGFIQRVTEDLNDLKLSQSAKFSTVRQNIQNACLPALEEAKDRLYVPGYGDEKMRTAILFGCIHRNQPFLLEIAANGEHMVYDDNYGNFWAIGCGTTLAQAFMRTHLNTNRDLRLGKILAYRVLEDSIELSDMGLAKPIHLQTLTLDGSLNKLGEQELKDLGETCEGWRELERETLDYVLGTSNSKDSEILPLLNRKT
jgi:20S proteasome alpha/beta subunit